MCRYYARTALKTKYKDLLNVSKFGLSDLDNYVDIYAQGLQSSIDFNVKDFIEIYRLEGKLAKLAYQLKTELENFKD